MPKPVRRFAKYLNTLNLAAPTDATELARLKGSLGSVIEFASNADALKASDTTIGTLRRGKYMLVQTKAAGTATPAKGTLAFVSDLDNFIVHTDGGATVDGKVAGVFICAVTKGNYCWIQVAGDATGLCRSSVTDTTDGNGAYVTTTANTIDGLADATADATAGPAKRRLGTFLEAPANDGLKRFELELGVYAHRSAAA